MIFNVPVSYADIVRKAVGDAGAGQVGNYTHCSFTIRGTGRFLPNDNANPHIGKVGQYEEVEEDQIQVDVRQDKMQEVIDALLKTHPYEEVGFEIYEQLDWKDIARK